MYQYDLGFCMTWPLSRLLVLMIIGCSQFCVGQNQLANESSLYLQKHANNPVNWVPWSPQALDSAKATNKLVIISIGYSACHWCQVMEEEAFSDTSIAAFMNTHFINIKVDKEERPDVDQKYSRIVQLMTGQSGWPLHCILLPNGNAIYGGTYFDKTEWSTILKKIVEVSKKDIQNLTQYSEELAALSRRSIFQTPDKPTRANADIFFSMIEDVEQAWDRKRLGFKEAQKFLNYSRLNMMVDVQGDHHLGRPTNMEAVSRRCLHTMHRSAIYDQVDGGFFRYSTDSTWNSPHYEKMLYDNAHMLMLYARAYKRKADRSYLRVIEQLYDFVEKNMSAPSGAFYASTNSSANGVEGANYLLSDNMMKAIVDGDRSFFSTVAIGENQHLLIKNFSLESYAKEHGKTIEEAEKEVDALRFKISEERLSRYPLGVDTKVITSWNALMASALLAAFEVTADSSILLRAEKCLSFLYRQQVEDSVVIHTDSKQSVRGLLEDHAQLGRACIHMYLVTADMQWLRRANELVSYAQNHFAGDDGLMEIKDPLGDPEAGKNYGFFENELEAPAAVMTANLLRLGLILNDPAKTDLGLRTLARFRQLDVESWLGLTSWNWPMLANSYGQVHVMIIGPQHDSLRQALLQKDMYYSTISSSSDGKDLEVHRDKFQPDKTLIYFCKNKTCQKPVESIEELNFFKK